MIRYESIMLIDQPQTPLPPNWPQSRESVVTLFRTVIEGQHTIHVGICHGELVDNEPMTGDYGQVVMDRLVALAFPTGQTAPVVFGSIASPQRAGARVQHLMARMLREKHAALLILCLDDPTKGAALVSLNVTGISRELRPGEEPEIVQIPPPLRR